MNSRKTYPIESELPDWLVVGSYVKYQGVPGTYLGQTKNIPSRCIVRLHDNSTGISIHGVVHAKLKSLKPYAGADSPPATTPRSQTSELPTTHYLHPKNIQARALYAQRRSPETGELNRPRRIVEID